jgi:hypothetical protein
LSGEERKTALREGLAAARAIKDEWRRAQALVALAPQLSGELLDEGLAAARAIGDEWGRAQALVAFLPNVPEPLVWLRAIRQAMADHLRNNLASGKRAAVLEFCADKTLFRKPILSPAALSAIAGHIIEICQHWEWL